MYSHIHTLNENTYACKLTGGFLHAAPHIQASAGSHIHKQQTCAFTGLNMELYGNFDISQDRARERKREGVCHIETTQSHENLL